MTLLGCVEEESHNLGKTFLRVSVVRSGTWVRDNSCTSRFAVFFEPHYQAIHDQAEDLRGLDPQALTRLFKRSSGIIRCGNELGL